MSAARFPLAGVLRVRRMLERRALAQAAQARARAGVAEATTALRKERLAQAHVPGSGSAMALTAALVARRSMAGDVVVAQGLHEAAQAEADERRCELVQARGHRRGVEVLEERWLAGREAEALRAQALEADEMATTRFAQAHHGDRDHPDAPGGTS